MRRCFYHTDLRQNAVFHNFAIQIALIQYLGRGVDKSRNMEHPGTFRNIPEHPGT